MGKRESREHYAAHDDADLDLFFGESRRKQSKRKDFQLCGQVQRAIATALYADFDDELLNGLWVVRVEPAPTVAHLLVWVAGPPGSSVEHILTKLHAVSRRLRHEVAATIERKHTPELSFAVCDHEVLE